MFGIALNLHCFCRKASVRWPINRLTPLRRRSRIWLHAFRRVYFGDNRRNAHYPRNYLKDYPRNYSGSHKGQAQTGGGCTPRRVGDRVTGIPKKVLLYSIRVFMRSLSGQFRLGRLLSKSQNLASREMCRLMYFLFRFLVSCNMMGCWPLDNVLDV